MHIFFSTESSTSHWKRWWQTLQQCLCHWISFYHRWSSSTQWHRTHCSRMFPSYQHDLVLATEQPRHGLQPIPAVYSAFEGDWFISWERGLKKRDQSEIKARSERDQTRSCNIYPQKLATVHAMTTFIAQALRRLYATNVWQCVCVFEGLCEFRLSELVSN